MLLYPASKCFAFAGKWQLSPHIDVSASKMLHCSRMTGSTACAATFEVVTMGSLVLEVVEVTLGGEP